MRNKRNNNVLGVAIAAALCLPVGSAYGGLYNVNDDLDAMPSAKTVANKVTVCTTLPADDEKGIGSCVPESTDFGDTPLKLANVPNKGIIYPTEIMQKPDDKDLPILPCDVTTPVSAAVLFVIDGENINDNTLVKFTLTGAKFSGVPILDISSASTVLTALSPTVVVGTGDKKSTVEFNIATADPNRVAVGDQFMLSYHLKDAQLATEGDQVTMKAEVTGSFDDSVVIARAKDGLSDIKLKAQAAGKVQIDITNENKKFADNGIKPAYLKDNKGSASICYLNVSTTTGDNDEYIAQCSGIAEFKFDETDGVGGGGDLEFDEDKTTLKITGAQFGASMGSNAVYINAHGDDADLDFDASDDDVATSTIDTDTFDATWKFKNEEFAAFHDSHDNDMPIIMMVDGIKKINVVEDSPMASLTIDFKQGNADTDDWAIVDFGPIESECMLITRNGMVCNVFNVPPIGAQDQLNLRITNESSKEAKFIMTLYGMDGSVLGGPLEFDMTSDLGGGFPLSDKYLQPGHTIRMTSDHLAVLFGDITWDGRARLEISSTLPKIEIMSLLRYANDPNLLTNMSTGASGASCTQ